mmetsp:Transcript_9137/g.20099  ORF Transcript_9137/g.20099 Transcript_9137/m.20099 type:complete len:271 (+) Transcript_9137:470-1282(+)
MSREFLMATCRKRGFVGAVPLLRVPGFISRTESALEPGAMSGTCRAAAGPRPKGFLFTWMAKPLSGTWEEFEKVSISLTWPPSRTIAAMTPKPVWPPWPPCVGARTGFFGVAAGAAEPPEPPNGSPPPSRSSRSSAPPPPPPAAPLRGPLSISRSISLRLCTLSSSSNSSSSRPSACVRKGVRASWATSPDSAASTSASAEKNSESAVCGRPFIRFVKRKSSMSWRPWWAASSSTVLPKASCCSGLAPASRHAATAALLPFCTAPIRICP